MHAKSCALLCDKISTLRSKLFQLRTNRYLQKLTCENSKKHSLNFIKIVVESRAHNDDYDDDEYKSSNNNNCPQNLPVAEKKGRHGIFSAAFDICSKHSYVILCVFVPLVSENTYDFFCMFFACNWLLLLKRVYGF